MENNQRFNKSADLQEQLLNASQVAFRLNISRSRTYSLMQRGVIPCVHVGKCRRVRREDLERFITSNIYSENKF